MPNDVDDERPSDLPEVVLKHFPLLVRSLVWGLVTLLAIAGVQVIWPGARLTKLERRVDRVDSVTAVRIGAMERDAARNALLTEGLAKLACKREWTRAELVLPCWQLLGNTIQDPRGQP